MKGKTCEEREKVNRRENGRKKETKEKEKRIEKCLENTEEEILYKNKTNKKKTAKSKFKKKEALTLIVKQLQRKLAAAKVRYKMN